LIGGSLDSKPDSQSNQVWVFDWNQNSKEWTRGPGKKLIFNHYTFLKIAAWLGFKILLGKFVIFFGTFGA
jgi:hypothetical protein